jgi:hypothetical protein
MISPGTTAIHSVSSVLAGFGRNSIARSASSHGRFQPRCGTPLGNPPEAGRDNLFAARISQPPRPDRRAGLRSNPAGSLRRTMLSAAFEIVRRKGARRGPLVDTRGAPIATSPNSFGRHASDIVIFWSSNRGPAIGRGLVADSATNRGCVKGRTLVPSTHGPNHFPHNESRRLR